MFVPLISYFYLGFCSFVSLFQHRDGKIDPSKIILSIFNIGLHDILSHIFNIQSRLVTNYSILSITLQTCSVLPILLIIHDIWYIFIHTLFHFSKEGFTRDVHQRCLDKRRDTSYWELFSFHPIEFLVLIDLPLLLSPFLIRIPHILYYGWMALTLLQLNFVSNNSSKGALFYKFWYKHRKRDKRLRYFPEYLLNNDISISYIVLPFHISKKDVIKMITEFIKEHLEYGKFIVNYHITECVCEDDIDNQIQKALYSKIDDDKLPWRLHLIYYEDQTHVIFKCDNLYHYKERKNFILSLMNFYRQSKIMFNVSNIKVNHYKNSNKILQTHIRDTDITLKDILTCNEVSIESKGIKGWIYDKLKKRDISITVDEPQLNNEIMEELTLDNKIVNEQLDNLYLTIIYKNNRFNYGLVTKRKIDISKIGESLY
jgi:hypothetical protein